MDLITTSPWIQARAAATPEREALFEAGSPVSYDELARCARGRAGWLQRIGVGPGSRVATLLRGGREFAELLHAIDLCGAAIVPLHWRRPAAELHRQIADSRASLLVHEDGELAELAREISPRGPRERSGCEEPSACRVIPSADADPFAILYTSGTTGTPKGVVLTRRNFAASAAASGRHLGVEPRDRWLACMPLFHVGGLSILTRSAIAGTSVVSHAAFDAAAVSRALDRDRITMLSLVPTMLQRLLDQRGERAAPDALRVLLLGGAPATEALLERALAAGYPVAPTYGLTEATSQVATRLPRETRRPVASHLRPLDSVELSIRDAEGAELAAGRSGEIWLRGPTVSAGSPAEFSQGGEASSEGGWRRTGDLGVQDGDGTLSILGRADDMIVSGGENVHPAEVERVLLAHPEVADVAVAGVPDREFGARPAAWVVLQGGQVVDDREFDRHCRASLAGYQVPVRFLPVAEIPRSDAGKVLRRQLVEGYAPGAASGS